MSSAVRVLMMVLVAALSGFGHSADARGLPVAAATAHD